MFQLLGTLRRLCAVPGRPRSCKATLICHSDPHLPFVPSPVMHFVLRTLAPFAFRQMQKACLLLACMGLGTQPCITCPVWGGR